LREQYLAQEVAAQVLLFPTTLELDPAESEAVREREADFRRFGLDVSARDNGTVTIHSTPKLLQRASAERVFRDLLAELGRQGRSFSAAVDLSLATMACHGSLRAGDQVSGNEAKVLLDALDNVDFASNCPHGRPIVSMTSWASLERRVGRR
jgi:DNA mismatch repair protein MutL